LLAQRSRFFFGFVAAVFLVWLNACATIEEPVANPKVQPDEKIGTAREHPPVVIAAESDDGSVPPLRVGVSPDYPPVIFENGGVLDGVEMDLARELARRLNRSLQLERIDWERQIPTLLDGRTDLIMSGMTVTEARKVRVDFTNPYMKTGLMAMLRKEDVERYQTRDDILNDALTIGVVAGTTADTFIERVLPEAPRRKLSDLREGVYALKDRRSIDVFVHDAPAVIWALSSNEAEIGVYWKLLTKDELAWAVRRDDQALKEQLNDALQSMVADGTLRRILLKWIPYYRQLEDANR